MTEKTMQELKTDKQILARKIEELVKEFEGIYEVCTRIEQQSINMSEGWSNRERTATIAIKVEIL